MSRLKPQTGRKTHTLARPHALARGVSRPRHEILDEAMHPIAKDITTHYTACETLTYRIEIDRGTRLDLLGV